MLHDIGVLALCGLTCFLAQRCFTSWHQQINMKWIHLESDDRWRKPQKQAKLQNPCSSASRTFSESVMLKRVIFVLACFGYSRFCASWLSQRMHEYEIGHLYWQVVCCTDLFQVWALVRALYSRFKCQFGRTVRVKQGSCSKLFQTEWEGKGENFAEHSERHPSDDMLYFRWQKLRCLRESQSLPQQLLSCFSKTEPTLVYNHSQELKTSFMHSDTGWRLSVDSGCSSFGSKAGHHIRIWHTKVVLKWMWLA